MKQKLRKILALLVLSVSVLGLTACGSTAKDSETTSTTVRIFSLYLIS